MQRLLRLDSRIQAIAFGSEHEGGLYVLEHEAGILRGPGSFI